MAEVPKRSQSFAISQKSQRLKNQSSGQKAARQKEKAPTLSSQKLLHAGAGQNSTSFPV